MPAINIASLPRSSTISPDLYFLSVRDPDGAAFNELILAQSSGSGGGGGSGKILVDASNTIFPNRPRLKLASSVLTFFDDPGNDQTLLGFNTSVLMQRANYDADGDGIIGLNNGGTGIDVPAGEAGFFGVGPNNSPVLFKTNLYAATSPSTTDDSTIGYTIGSRWVFGPNEWICTDATPSNAIWSRTTGGGGGGSSSLLTIQAGGTDLPARSNLNFLGSGLTLIYDDPSNDATVVQIEQGDMTKSVYDADLDGIINAEAGGTGLDLTNSYEGFLYCLPIANTSPIVLRQNFGAFSQPNTSADSDNGYGLGSLWLERSNSDLWFNIDATPNNAKWQKLAKHTEFLANGTPISFKPSIDFVGFTISQTQDKLLIEPPSTATVQWLTHPASTNLQIRDNLHGKTIKVAGTLEILCPGNTTAQIRDGFQINVLLVTPNGSATFLPEDAGTTINARNNVLTEQWGSVHLSYEASTNAWFAIGYL